MSTLAVVATFYQRPWAIPRLAEALQAQTRPWLPDDEVYLLYEYDDHETDRGLLRDFWVNEADTAQLPILVAGNNPLSVEINTALDIVDVGDTPDYVTYLTDDSLPDPRKYEVMARALDENPDWGVVYCSQDYGRADSPEDWLAGGRHLQIRQAHPIEDEPFCVVDHTQVMHRRTKARWPLDYGSRRLSDAHFWNALKDDLGPFHGIGEVLDWTRQLPGGLSDRA